MIFQKYVKRFAETLIATARRTRKRIAAKFTTTWISFCNFWQRRFFSRYDDTTAATTTTTTTTMIFYNSFEAHWGVRMKNKLKTVKKMRNTKLKCWRILKNISLKAEQLKLKA